MADNNPSSPDSDGNGGNEPAAGHHDVALAIQSFDGSYKAAQSDRAQHDHKILLWSRLTGSFVIGYVTPPNASGELSGFRFVTAQSEGPITKNDGIFIDSHDMGVILVGRGRERRCFRGNPLYRLLQTYLGEVARYQHVRRSQRD